MKTLGLLQVGHIDPASVHAGGDYPELFEALFAPTGIKVQAYDVAEGDLPASLADCDGWLCSPSRASVYDELPWIAAVEELIRACVAAEVPFVGVCFGHQLLAQALGGTVERAPGGWGIGAQDFEIVAPQPWMRPAQPTLRLAASHQDQVVAVPDGAEVIARAGYCPIGGLQVGERAWSVQTHPELTREVADSLLVTRTPLFGAELAESARATLSQPLDRDVFAQWVATFLDA